ncbi:uncharacterized protein LOC5510092 isoform X2 [Nematostella vectensis]|nr:uncharacterized protein LOC5510092 isoform X2 [Nematostella vectensis]XP_032235134.2 uncharacterized protein LOC5510092 isoform X2 [Nematostella vectensis]XP_032235136.2 uncharacterized protein LOC5510092 isoform X2 [Nematostella vectensis]XP_032235137.2 uncharacterized protein LOC5510092 isoform X2 [Nematostella vectensis]XP_032235138.2 uncharacterized protein LOC5510092 isoform X2 [Nematostella vectensis]
MLIFTVTSLLLLLTQPIRVQGIGECSTNPTARCQGEVSCPACITMLWNPFLRNPPYVERPDNTTFEGIMHLIFMSMLHHCCGINPYNPMSCGELQHKTYEIGDVKPASDIEMPVIVNFKESGLRSQKKVVPMLPHTGVAFVVRRDRVEGDYSIQLLTSVFSAWPVLILTLLLSVLAGMIAWALDTSKNPKDFPRSFVHGACEGFWWAFVSMTTVGYGDRCPKSIQGRAFAVIWILVGICIISIFTATLTTSLTTISLDNKISLPGSKVAALVHSIDAITGFQAQADVKRFHTFEGVRAAMDNDEVVGALLDSYMIAKHKKSLPDAKYKVQEVIHQESLEYGAHVNDSGLSQCLTNFRYSKESMLYEIVEILLEKPLASGVREGSGTSDNDKLFDPDGEMFSRTLYVCFGVVGLCLLAGFTYELYRYKGGCRFRRVPENDAKMSLTPHRPPFHSEQRDAMFDEMERRLTEELHRAIAGWRTKMCQRDSVLKTDEVLSSV